MSETERRVCSVCRHSRWYNAAPPSIRGTLDLALHCEKLDEEIRIMNRAIFCEWFDRTPESTENGKS